MNAFPVPFKVVATVFLTGILVLIGVLNLQDRSEWTDPWDGVLWLETHEGLKASAVADAAAGGKAGLRRGDRLVSINGKPVTNLAEYSAILDRLGVEANATYVVKSSGTDQAREVPVDIGAKPMLTSRDALRVILAFLHLGIGLFVILRGPALPRSFHFYLICLAAFVVYLYSYTPNWGGLDQTVYGLSVAAFLLLPSLFLHFCMRFPVELSGAPSRALFAYIPAAALAFLHVSWISGRLASLG